MYGLELTDEEDVFVTRGAGTVATSMTIAVPDLTTTHDVEPERTRRLAYIRRVVELVGRCTPDVETARTAVTAASVDREGVAAIRAHDVWGLTGIGTTDAEREFGSAPVDRGFGVDLDNPDYELRVCFSENTCLIDWIAVEAARDFTDREPTDRPFSRPDSMAPADARAFINVAGTEPGARILDPMCGASGALLEASLIGTDTVGVGTQAKMVGGTRENPRYYVGPGNVVCGDITTLLLHDDSMDGAMSDAPYGRQLKITHHSFTDFVGGALAEIRRVVLECVVIADQSWAEAAENADWRVKQIFERRVHRSLMRYVHLLHR